MLPLGAIGGLGLVLAIILIVVFLAKRYRIAKPDEAIIVTGGRGKADGSKDGDLSSQKVVTGGGVFVLPFVQKSYTLSLESRRLNLTTEAQTKDGITIQAQAVAVVKVGGTNALIRSAAQRFLSNPDEIDTSTQEVLSGSLRALIGTLTLEEIMGDRAAVATKVLEAADEALTKQGLVVDTLQIQSVRDNQNYLENRGRPEAARVKREAEVAEAVAQRESEEAKIAAEMVILEKQRELKNKEAEVMKETDRIAAEAAAAKPLEQARQQQLIAEQNQILAEKEVAVKEQQLNSDVRVVADAKEYEAKKMADVRAYEIAKQAEADANAHLKQAEADKQARFAAAEAEQAEGLAKAAAIQAIGLAEAETIEARGDALAEQSEQILAQQMIEVLPEMIEKYASAVSGIDNLTVIASDGTSGTSSVANESIGGVKAIMDMTKSTLGIDIPGLINAAVAGGATGNAAGEALTREKHALEGHSRVAEKRNDRNARRAAEQAILPTEAAPQAE